MQPQTIATSRANRASKSSAAVRASASYAYVSGNSADTQRSHVAISSRATNSPQRRICGKTTAGMNCTAWNSVSAKALMSRPSVLPRTAFATASRTTTDFGPSTSRPSSPNARSDTSVACTTATSANAIP